MRKAWFHLRMSRILFSETKLDDIAHEQTIICRQLVAGHVVGSWPMKRKRNLQWMIISFIANLFKLIWTALTASWRSAVSNRERLLFSYFHFLNLPIQINCVASYCACSQSFNRLAHSQSSNVTRTMAGASLYLSIFSFASKPALHYGEVKDEEGKRIVYNITDKRLRSCTVLYDLLSQCSSGRERIGWLLLKFKVNVKQVFFYLLDTI